VIVYLVESEYGSYSDYCRIPFCAFYSREHAEQKIAALRAEASATMKEFHAAFERWSNAGSERGQSPKWPVFEGTSIEVYDHLAEGLQITEIELS
jgi:hypothetical protein